VQAEVVQLWFVAVEVVLSSDRLRRYGRKLSYSLPGQEAVDGGNTTVSCCCSRRERSDRLRSELLETRCDHSLQGEVLCYRKDV
jgi:hypothetical protein